MANGESKEATPSLRGAAAVGAGGDMGSETGFRSKKERQVEESEIDSTAYPILTEEVGYPPSPVSSPSGAPAIPGTSPIGQIAARAVADVLGWKPKQGDAKGFVGALTQAFSLTETEGHVQATWTPRTYAVQTDLSGGISGAQASIYARGKDALDQSLPLLDGLYALDPEAAAEDIAALKAVVKSQLSELVNELAFPSGPRVQRVNQYFHLLLGHATFPLPAKPGNSLQQSDPDKIEGTLGNLRDELGLNFTQQDFVNSLEDEQDLSNFRILSDYVTSLAQSWINNLSFFGLNTTTPFFGTQLVLLSRQLSVVAESVDEVRFTLDSVFIGPAERQTLQLNFTTQDQPLFAEDLFSWIQNFASEEGPRLIQDGGKFAVHNTFLPIVRQLHRMVGAIDPKRTLHAFKTPRVQRSLRQLSSELQELVRLASPIRHTVTPEPVFDLPLRVTTVSPSFVSVEEIYSDKGALISIGGNSFEMSVISGAIKFPTIELANSEEDTAQDKIPAYILYFRSENLMVAQITKPASAVVSAGTYDVTITNGDKQSFTLRRALTITD